MSNKRRIVICGPAAAGKDFLKKRFKQRGLTLDVSYTSRPIRDGEINGDDYDFISEKEFKEKIENNYFYEYEKHGDYYYGTGIYEWESCEVFIMETGGISKITPEDRKSCFIIFLNPPEHIRIMRLQEIRKWDMENINHRLKTDKQKFDNFKDYDLIITNPDF